MTADDRHRIIVGLDYGTTFSGISYVTSNETGADNIEVINQWPGTSETVSKVPTKIAYASQNDNINVDKWGFAVTATMVSYMWTKLLLDGSTPLTEFDDPALKDISGEGMLKLPPNRSARQVCSDYLKGLHAYMVDTLCKRFSTELYSITPVEYWITIPAIWSDAAKDATRSAALEAGFGCRPLDQVNLIPEPEAAAILALKVYGSHHGIDPVSPGDGVLICDCGGGTVDITTYTVLATRPKLQFEELCIGVGGKCGSTYIDRNFSKWMAERFGCSYTSLPPKRRGPGSSFMRSFESAKKAFGSKLLSVGDQKFIEVENIYMAGVHSSLHYDSDEGVVKLTWHEMKGFFDPVINDIIRLVSSQVDLAKKKNQHIGRIILVGGFGDSDYLNERMRIWCMQNGSSTMKLICPPQCQAAVVKGAALRGLESLVPLHRKARRHYGFVVNKPFRPGVDPEDYGFIDEFSMEKVCRERMDWVIRKGQAITPATNASFNLALTTEQDELFPECEVTLYCCSLDQPPDYAQGCGAERVGQITIHFSSKDLKRSRKRYNPVYGKTFCKLDFVVKTDVNSTQGILAFKSYSHGRPTGNATIDYTHIESGPTGRD
ncbi:Chaperone protein DnaK [Lasiodiplodia hormozganensis]|uniref:Chaperone protein DnaK n=1 Tax=Lasiodiplodia hormozganensis TaxID=869390 RepID=A0AA40CQR4_9PEZI|nr:Chaperone protein DnaK [Lasiodiplodia hormozganensis]